MNTMKQLLTLVSFLFLFLAAGPAYSQCLLGDCVNGKGILLYPGGERYIGQFWERQKHGEGTFFYANGSRYQGQWARDHVHGYGVKLFRDGTHLEGYWEKGKLISRGDAPSSLRDAYGIRGEGETGCFSGNCYNGKGVFVMPGGAVYIGEFSAGEIDGVGVCYFADGSKYQGEWRRRYPEGRGTKTYADGTVHTGRWKMGQPVDQDGRIADQLMQTVESGNDGTEIQTGCLSGDCSDGPGTYAYADGSRYEGQFADSLPHGQGEFYYADGNRYAGAFSHGIPHGQGRLEKADGSVLSGEWRNGELLEQAESAPAAGCVSGDCSNGYGTYVFQDGSKYVGSFRNSRPHGQGTIQYANGDRYEGQLADAAFNGEGTLYLQDGRRLNGQWKDGAFLGSDAPASAATATPTSSSPAPAGETGGQAKVWAVVIGVASYNHMPVLRYTDDDAYRIYAFLKSPEGGAIDDSRIRILIDEDATKKKILNAIDDTFGKAGPNDLVVLYFSGHGLKGSFLPIDFDGFNNKLYHEEINQALSKSPAKLKLCIADACHSGSLLAMRDGELPDALNSYYQHLANAKAGTALIMSSKSDETSLESSGLRQGVFSHFLIRGLKGEADRDQDKAVTIQELYDFISLNVRSYTRNRQSPVIQGDYDQNMIVAVKQ